MKRVFFAVSAVMIVLAAACFVTAFAAGGYEQPEDSSENAAAEIQPVTVIAAVSAQPVPEEPAEPQTEEPATLNMSAPRLMLTGFSLDTGYLKPGKKSTLTVTLRNYSSVKALYNVKLSFSDDSGFIIPEGPGTQYAEAIQPGSEYTWVLGLTCPQTAQTGEYAVRIQSEYEDGNFTSFSASDVVRLAVRQNAGLDYSGLMLPASVVEGDTVTLDMSFMNTGKCRIRNLRIDFDVPELDSGGTTFIGEIEAGESCPGSANLRVGSEAGETDGTITISYEDEFGEAFSEAVSVSTVIEKKPVVKSEEAEEEERKYPLWWGFLLTGLITGGGIGCAVPIFVNSRRQRKDDELRL